MGLPQIAGPWHNLAWPNDELLDPVYLAAVEALDEVVRNAMLAAEDVPTARPAGAICRRLDPDRVHNPLAVRPGGRQPEPGFIVAARMIVRADPR